MKARSSHSFQQRSHSSGFTLIELLVVIAIIAILAVVVVLTLNPAQLLAQSRDANRVSDMATLTSALNLYTTDQAGASTFNMGNASDTYISIYDPAATSTNACPSLGLPALNASSGQAWQCSASSSFRTITTGWLPVNLSQLSPGSPIGNLPVDPTNQTSTGLFYVYSTNGSQLEVTADLESQKYKAQYGTSVQTSYFPEVISGGTQGLSALYNSTGLVGYWPMEEGAGSSTLDQSGNNLKLQFYNAVNWTGGKVGDAIALSGGYVASQSYFPTPQSGSYTMWINPLLVTGAYPSLGKISSPSNFQINSSTAQAYFNNAGGPSCSQAFTTNNWQMVAGTWSSSTLTQSIYLNGVLCGSGNSLTLPTSTTSTISIGSSLSGAVDDVRMYNRALSPAEIMALYNAEK